MTVTLADDTATVSAYTATVDRDDARLRRLMAEAPAVSLHDHPFLLPVPLDHDTWGRWAASHRVELGYRGLAESGMQATVACLNSWHTYEELTQVYARLRADIVHHEGFHVADTLADVTRTGSLAVILGMESMTSIAHDVSRIEILYGMGIRVAGLIYSDGSYLGAGLNSAVDDGLTSQGAAFVDEMNALGMVVDLAHVGDRTSLDAIERSRAPVLISHAGSRSLWPTSRMKPDDVLRALADSGGVIGVEAAPNTTCSPHRDTHDIHAVMDHVEHLVELLGVDHVALGPDVLYGRHHELHRVRGANKSVATAPPGGQVEFVDGVENPTEAFWNITWWLMDRGWGDDDIRKILGGNALRVFAQVMH